ncbi:MAG: AmmeMemoRadiSam system protein A [Bacillota bacterium]|nr:AmmeMemoRadiSam system protein A [Bacillota bacterium]MDW7684532.1 AmmeMemoRadiSam system protein A [Bacillota bacterium]
MRTIVHAGIYPHPPIIIPEVGGQDAGKAAATVAAMEELARRTKKSGADTLVLITPHGPVFQDAIALLASDRLEGSFNRFGFPDVEFQYHNDKHLLDAVEIEADRVGIRTAHIDKRSASAYGVQAELDHGALVPLYYLQKAGVKLPMIHITIGLLQPRQLFTFGKAVQSALVRLKRRAAVIASGDMSHRLSEDAPAGFSPAGEEFDRKLIKLLENYDVNAILSMNASLLEDAGECGFRSLSICLGILDGQSVQPEVVSYEAPFGVGYLVADLTPGVIRKTSDVAAGAEESKPVRLARKTLETFVRTGEIIPPPTDSPLANERAGAFVSLKIDGQLRGCIGTIEPVRENLASEIIENAISAGMYDPRFRPVTKEELPKLEYSVDVLSEAEEVCGPHELDAKKYGVIVQSGNKRGLLLPDLEGVDTVAEQLSIALQKAGIAPHETYRIFRFYVERYR